MREEIIDGERHIYVRQSWLGTAIEHCLERGRRDALREESVAKDATILGTGLHGGAEWTLKQFPSPLMPAPTSAFPAAVDAARKAIDQELAGPHILTDETPASLKEKVVYLLGEWWRLLYPAVCEEGILAVEWKFCVPFCTVEINGEHIHIHIEGTADVVTQTGLWDWKTSSRTYQEAQYQKWAIQPTVYSHAAAVTDEWDHDYPVSFTYGVITKKPIKTQRFSVVRTPAHAEWLARQIRQLVILADRFGWDEPWPMRDTGFLCSDRWCDHWWDCKGASVPVALMLKKNSA